MKGNSTLLFNELIYTLAILVIESNLNGKKQLLLGEIYG